MNKRWMTVLLVVYALGVLVLHSMPVVGIDLEDLELGPVEIDNVIHVTMFLPWGAFGLPYVCKRMEGRISRAFVWFCIGVALATLAEGTQFFLPYRSLSLLDLFCNVAGVVLGSLAVAMFWRCQRSDNSGFCRA